MKKSHVTLSNGYMVIKDYDIFLHNLKKKIYSTEETISFLTTFEGYKLVNGRKFIYNAPLPEGGIDYFHIFRKDGKSILLERKKG